jgi:uncharacterized protein with HEPN domain
VQRYCAGLSREAFFSDERTVDAVIHNVQVIGEAAKHVPEGVCQQIPDVEWRKVAGMRDWVVHVYFGIDPDILWDVVANKIHQLEHSVRTFLDANP